MKLYEFNTEIEKALANAINEETGEIADFEAIEKLELAKEEKVESCCLAYLNLEAEIKALAEQEEKFKKRKNTLKSKAEWLKNYIKTNVDKPYTFTEAKITMRASEELVITDQNALEQFCKGNTELCTYEFKPNKTAIKQALTSGITVEGVEILQKTNISIK